MGWPKTPGLPVVIPSDGCVLRRAQVVWWWCASDFHVLLTRLCGGGGVLRWVELYGGVQVTVT